MPKDIWRYEIPRDYFPEQLPWSRILIRSGFYAKERGNIIELFNETERNIQFLSKIIEKYDFGRINEGFFIPREATIDQIHWLQAIDNCHTGAEGGMPDDLEIMDTYMAGLIRWLNEIGISTHYSCDGHGISRPLFETTNMEIAQLAVKILNKKTKCFIANDRSVEFVDKSPSRDSFEAYGNRTKLLDFAEWLFKKKSILKKQIPAQE